MARIGWLASVTIGGARARSQSINARARWGGSGGRVALSVARERHELANGGALAMVVGEFVSVARERRAAPAKIKMH